MDKYVLFAGADYYPSGGMEDIKGWFPDEASAVEAGRTTSTNRYMSPGYEWWQVVDSKTWEVVKEGSKGQVYSVGTFEWAEERKEIVKDE